MNTSGHPCKTAFLFPGQGSQTVGMLAALADASPVVEETFAEASTLLGFDLWRIVREGPADRLNDTRVTQPALLAAGIACWRFWRQTSDLRPDYLAGHSLGEYSALVAAGALDFAAAVELVAERGRLMQAAVPAGAGKMAAIIGLGDEAVERACSEAAPLGQVSAANYNSPGQVVIAGDSRGVDAAMKRCQEAGARRAVVLPVSVPSHCALMREAAERLGERLREVTIHPPEIPVVHNVDAALHAGAGAGTIRQLLAAQLYSPVRWTESMTLLLEHGVNCFAECGPGNVLAGLAKRIARDRGPAGEAVTLFTLEQPAHHAELAERLAGGRD